MATSIWIWGALHTTATQPVCGRWFGNIGRELAPSFAPAPSGRSWWGRRTGLEIGTRMGIASCARGRIAHAGNTGGAEFIFYGFPFPLCPACTRLVPGLRSGALEHSRSAVTFGMAHGTELVGEQVNSNRLNRSGSLSHTQGVVCFFGAGEAVVALAQHAKICLQ